VPASTPNPRCKSLHQTAACGDKPVLQMVLRELLGCADLAPGLRRPRARKITGSRAYVGRGILEPAGVFSSIGASFHPCPR